MHLKEGEEFAYECGGLAQMKIRPGTILEVTADEGPSSDFDGARQFVAKANYVPEKPKGRKS